MGTSLHIDTIEILLKFSKKTVINRSTIYDLVFFRRKKCPKTSILLNFIKIINAYSE